MTITRAPGELRWTVHLHASAERVFEMIATDRGRERFWAERSTQTADLIVLEFPDGTDTTMRMTAQSRPHLLVFDYFDVHTTFALRQAGEDRTDLQVTASGVPSNEVPDVAAGWVSVLLNLKAVLNFGCDLRNHDAGRSWREGFVDN